jgi:hypothetical protein
MRLIVDDTTRFFTVVGAPYLPERHANTDIERLAPLRDPHDANTASRSEGSWLNDR